MPWPSPTIDTLIKALSESRQEQARHSDHLPSDFAEKHAEAHTYEAADGIETAIMNLSPGSPRAALVQITIAAFWTREMIEVEYAKDEIEHRNKLTWHALRLVDVIDFPVA